ncbi:MAG: P-loop NTPase, partial [Frankiales bacterium]|nr:P-loop NTPase [Frankiales bacterium]
GVAVIGLVPDGAEDAERRLRQLGVAHVVASSATPEMVAETIRTAVGTAPAPAGFAVADPWGAVTGTGEADAGRPAGDDDVEAPPSRVVAVWGPYGAPGRTTVAVTLAGELADLGVETLLVDADVYGGAIAQLLGLLDEAPGLAAACRLANNGTLDLPGLAELALTIRPRLRVLTGISRPERWPEIRPTGLDVVLSLARSLAAVVVVDCAFSLEQDEELSFDTVAPRRNGATLTAIAAADTVVAVASGDPVGLQRFVRGHAEPVEIAPKAEVVPVVNRLRAAAVGGGDARREITAALERFGGIAGPRFVPLDVAGLDAAVASGRMLAECTPKSPVRQALRVVAAELAGIELPRGRRGRRPR